MNNVVRTAVEALAAVLGGTQSLHTNALDEVMALPTEDAGEAGPPHPADHRATRRACPTRSTRSEAPYFVEAATDRIEAEAELIFARLDDMGNGSMLEGVLAGIEGGWFQQQIADAAFAEQRRYESGDLVKVGVNAFVASDEEPIDTLVIGPEGEATQREALSRLRTTRDDGAVTDALGALIEAAATEANLIEPLVHCARSLCTEGEIVRALTDIFGGYREVPAF